VGEGVGAAVVEITDRTMVGVGEGAVDLKTGCHPSTAQTPTSTWMRMRMPASPPAHLDPTALVSLPGLVLMGTAASSKGFNPPHQMIWTNTTTL
jgi:hypothetical protein